LQFIFFSPVKYSFFLYGSDAVSTKCIALPKYNDVIQQSEKLAQASTIKQAKEIKNKLLAKLNAGELDADLASTVSIFYIY
jgi:hypothetical protein